MTVFHDFLQSVRDYGLLSALIRAYTFSEALVLYHLSKSGVFDPEFEDTPFSVIERENATAVILGSGGSINDISDREWDTLSKRTDLIAFNHFYRGEFIDIDYHIIREMAHGPGIAWRHEGIVSYINQLTANPCYDETTFFALHDERATDAIWTLYVLDGLSGRRVCQYQNDRDRDLPGERIDEIAHGAATLFDAINLAYLMGYDRIVLAGVDLYDRRYFWLSEDEARQVDRDRGASTDDVHNTSDPVLEQMPDWRSFLAERGVELAVENERSLLCTTDVLPSFDIREELEQRE